MRRGFTVLILFVAGVALAQRAAFAQQGGPALRTAHFEIYADPADVHPGDAQVLARQMEGRFAAYNQIFRFDPERLPRPLRVRVFRSRELYESYVGARIEGAVPPGAVYLHFGQSELRELIIHLGSEAEALPFQAFIQFLRAFVPDPPIWIRDGFGVHFATLALDEEGVPTHRENLAWLDAVKAMRGGIPSPEAIMRATAPATVHNFPGVAWSLVSFFLNSGNYEYLRSFTESFMMLRYESTAEENAAAVIARIALWNNLYDIARDHLRYLDSRRSFSELVADGQRAYISGYAAIARATFRRALEIRPDHYAPWYYLGLLAYNEGDTATAEWYYRMALSLGADTASVLYAMALNAATATRIDEAIELLRQSAQIAPGRFRERAETLIYQLEQIRER